jgi:hypothetical protein
MSTPFDAHFDSTWMEMAGFIMAIDNPQFQVSLQTRIVLALLGLFFVLWLQTAFPVDVNDRFLPLDQVQPGMKGVGRTVFSGDQIEEFQVEILGVLENIAPRQSAILARVSGGPIEKTGVMAGMSGSPVYINGKLIGALSFTFPFASEALAGITPIQQMVDIFDKTDPVRIDPIKIEVSSVAPHRTVGMVLGNSGFNPWQAVARSFPIQPAMVRGETQIQPLSGQNLSFLETPVFFSGFSPLAVQRFGEVFKGSGMQLIPASALTLGSGSGKMTEGSDIQPGSSIAVQLVRGDLGVGASAIGTVTFRDGDKIYAFGHPWLSVGPVELPFTKAKVITLAPNLQSSFKIAVPTELAGSITQDRSLGVYGVVGLQPKLIPLTINLYSSRNRKEVYKYEVVNDRFLTPYLTNFLVFNTITSNERALGDSTLMVQGTINVKGQPEIKIENLFSSDSNAQAYASLAVVQPLMYVLGSGFSGVDVENITLDITSKDEKRIATLDRVWAERTEVRAGETINLSAYLRTESGEEHVERIPLVIPSDLPTGPLLVTVSDGATLMSLETRIMRQSFVPKDLDQLIRAINNIRKNDRMYVRLQRPEPAVILRGEELSNLPPSFSAVVASERTSSSSLLPMRSSNLYEFELPSTSLVITGVRRLTLDLVD